MTTSTTITASVPSEGRCDQKLSIVIDINKITFHRILPSFSISCNVYLSVKIRLYAAHSNFASLPSGAAAAAVGVGLTGQCRVAGEVGL